jgi:WD40 repeat protein
LFLLNVLPSNANPGKELTSTIKLEKTQWASISNLFWSVLNPTYETQSLQVYAPYIVVASLNNDSIQDSSTLLQNLTMYYTDKFSLLRQYLQARSMQYSWLDALHPYRLITYFSHYRNLLPSIILLLVWIGIMLWMNTFVREQYMLPIMRVAFVRIVTFFLRIIARVTSIQTDSLIRKVETEYNEDGMHLGAISLHSQFHLQQTRDRVPNVSIRTLFGEHSADIKDMACGGGTETGRKLVSTDQDGRLVLWNITEEVDTAIARLDQQRQLGGGLNGWMGTRYQQKGQTPIELRQLPPARCVQMESQGKFVIAGYEQGYICIWNAETAHVVRELYVQDAPKESRNNRVMHLLFLEPKETNIKKKKPSSSKYILSAHKNGYLREWNIKTGEMIKSFDSNHKRDISAIHVLADNQHPHKLWIFTASKDGIVKCWERTFIAGHDMQPTTNWQCLYSIQAHNGHMITSLAAHQLHNGMGILVTGSSGGGVCVWQLTSGKPLGVLSNDSADGKASQNQKDGLLLQFSRVAQQQDNSLRQRQSQTQGLARADHGRSVNQVVITRLACPEFDNDMCDNCQTTLNTGFLVASCALDDSVHCWRLDRTMRNDVGCTRCIKEYQHRPYHCQAPVPPTTTGPPRASQRKKRNNNNHQSQSGDESEDETELLSLSVSFLGKLDQVDGQGLVFCDNMVLAGVRRRQIRLDNNDDADLWEAWFVSLQYYEPPPIKEEEDAFFIPVIAFDLEKDEEYYREIEEKEMLHDQELAKSSSLWDHLLLNIFGIKKVRAATWPIEATTITTRKRSLKNEPLLDTDVNGKDEDAYEILPFSTIRLVLSMKGFGFYCEYGNFIKLVSFGNPDEIHSSTASTSSR